MPYKKIAFFIVVGLLVLTINNLAHSLYTIWQKQDLILQTQKKLTEEKKENHKLKKALAQVNQPQFVESEARNKLLLAKPGEGIVIIPPNKLITSPTPSPKMIDQRPNWQKWWDVFFKS